MAAIKMDELLVSWLGSDAVYEKVLNLIETHRSSTSTKSGKDTSALLLSPTQPSRKASQQLGYEATVLHAVDDDDIHLIKNSNSLSDPEYPPPPPPRSPYTIIPRDITIPPFYTPNEGGRGRGRPNLDQSWTSIEPKVGAIFNELGLPLSGNMILNSDGPSQYLLVDNFMRITKEICNFPNFFNGPLYRRILLTSKRQESDGITLNMMKNFWEKNMERFDAIDRFFRLVKQPDRDYISRDDFLPYIEELLVCHPGLEFLLNHAEFQEKYAVTVITRIFYSVNTCHNGKITARQIRKSDLLQSFHAVDEEEDINKITRYFSYEHFYVLYCRFWELDHDRDYRITREDLLKYGEHSLSHLIVDRIFDAAPRPFETVQEDDSSGRDYLSYEDFIFFMLSEEDKANEISVRYWFSCIDVDGDGKLNNMEMRSFYAVQLHRMQCLGHEIVPFEDMLCQMIDMIKPKSTEFFLVEDFLQPECVLVSGTLFDALFNLNKYLQFESRDPYLERQKREDEFESAWDRFACYDYNRLAMEEEAREEEAMEIDWVTVDDDEDDGDDFNSLGLGGASEAPF